MPSQHAQTRDHLSQLYGEWTAHNIEVDEGVFTMPQRQDRQLELLVASALQSAQDVLHRPFSTMKVLDLGCLEGGYAIEFARQGAQVIGVEARANSVEKARFAASALNLSNVQFLQADVRQIDAQWLGHFDVILVWGLLYHLPAPDVFAFLRNLKQMSRGILVIDTHVALSPQVSVDFEGTTYWGRTYTEHSPQESEAQKLDKAWASIDNNTSFWFTRPSLYNFLNALGFTSVFENVRPLQQDRAIDRINVTAVAGNPVSVHRHGLGAAASSHRWAENDPRFASADPSACTGLFH